MKNNINECKRILFSYPERVNALSIDDLRQISLHKAAESDADTEIIELLIEKGANIDALDLDKYTPLLIAVLNNRYNICQLLLKNNANVNLKEKTESKTPLHVAVYKNNLQIAELLLNNNAEIDMKDNEGYTALHIAIEEGHLEMCKLLLNNNANTNIENFNRNTPITLAESYSQYCKDENKKKQYLEIYEMMKNKEVKTTKTVIQTEPQQSQPLIQRMLSLISDCFISNRVSDQPN